MHGAKKVAKWQLPLPELKRDEGAGTRKVMSRRGALDVA